MFYKDVAGAVLYWRVCTRLKGSSVGCTVLAVTSLLVDWATWRDHLDVLVLILLVFGVLVTDLCDFEQQSYCQPWMFRLQRL